MSDRHLVLKDFKRLALAGALLYLGACAGPSGTAPIDDRTRGGQRAAPAQPVPASGMHTVQRGETLYQIAFRYGTDWRTLAANNGLTQPFTIYPGQQIAVGAPRTPAARPAVTAQSPSPGAATTAPRPAPAAPARPTPAPSAAALPPGATSSRPATPAPTAQVPARVAGWNWPADGPLIARFGSLNKGIDIAGQLGQPVRAAADGAVVYAGRGLIGYGEMLIIKHDETYLSAYAHNSRLLVNEGDKVRAGQTVAEMGSSGTDRVKLHFEIRRRGQPVDPMTYLPKR